MAIQTNKGADALGATAATGQVPASIEASFLQTKAFSSKHASSIVLSATDANRYANEEAAFGRIDIDDRGLTAGMRLHLLEADP